MDVADVDSADDCASITPLSSEAVFHTLRGRYERDIIHTYAGVALVVINPYKGLPPIHGVVRPHVCAVADDTYRALLRTKQNQSILMTGESGAGKSESTKLVIQYLGSVASRANAAGSRLREQIEQGCLLLEAFGNASTNRNDNSSRFGRFIRVQFSTGGIICGAIIETFLLEKARVVHQGPGERSFHIFYQVKYSYSSFSSSSSSSSSFLFPLSSETMIAKGLTLPTVRSSLWQLQQTSSPATGWIQRLSRGASSQTPVQARLLAATRCMRWSAPAAPCR